MQNTQVCHILSKDELPIEVDVGQEHRYHSVFACPILRQQTTDQNPPMKLVCGHVISKDALNKLSIQNKLKCPYCPLGQLFLSSIRSRSNACFSHFRTKSIRCTATVLLNRPRPVVVF